MKDHASGSDFAGRHNFRRSMSSAALLLRMVGDRDPTNDDEASALFLGALHHRAHARLLALGRGWLSAADADGLRWVRDHRWRGVF